MAGFRNNTDVFSAESFNEERFKANKFNEGRFKAEGFNEERFDPCKNFKFRVMWDGKCVAFASKVGNLKPSANTVKSKEAGSPLRTRITPGKAGTEPVTVTQKSLILEEGIIHDPEFELWAKKSRNYILHMEEAVSHKDFRKDLVIEVYNEAGKLASVYKVYRCWVSEYQALPELDASGNAVAIQSIKLENEGWERDQGISESGDSAEPDVSDDPAPAES